MKTIFITLLLLLVPLSASSQRLPLTDTSIVFTPAVPFSNTAKEPSAALYNSIGLDVLLSNNGFGLGMFFRKEYTAEIAGSLHFAISDVKDASEMEYYDYYTGQTYTPGKKNRLLMLPLMVCLQYRMFKDDILDNFRPYVMAGGGPTMLFVSPYARINGQIQEDIDFFSSLKYGQAHFTLGGFVGAGAFFGANRGSLSGVSIRYYIIQFANGVEIMTNRDPVKTFGGLFITLNFGSLY
jgi:hypothetical protein